TLIRRPEQSFNAGLSYRSGSRVSASAQLFAVGKRADRDFHFPATPVMLEAYNRVDVGAEYALRTTNSERTALTLSVENLTNMHYQNAFNFLAPRRTVYLGL